MAVFEDLNGLNINGHTEKKNVGGKDLTYLSWPWAWAEVKKRYPDAHYSIWRGETGLPYTVDPMTGIMVYTSVTIEGITHEMWLPVMDGANRAMRLEEYDYKVKNPKFRYAKWNEAKKAYIDNYGNVQEEYQMKHCDAATMTDINKTIMRCLVKNLAMFGLGLYIYAGEDLPEAEKADAPEPTAPEFTRPNVNAAVTAVEAIPSVPAQEEKPKDVNPVTQYLLEQMGELREMRKIKPAANNELFKKQKEKLIEKGLAPNKGIDKYTMQEAEALIDAMKRCFELTGTELITE